MFPVALKKLYQIWENPDVVIQASPFSPIWLDSFSSPWPVLLYLGLNDWLCAGMNRISTGWRAGDIVRSSSWPSTLLGVDWAHSLSSLKDCLLVKSTPSNLISRLPQSETAYKAAPAARKAPLASWTKQVIITFSWMSSQGQCREDLNVNYYPRLINFHNIFFLSIGN